MPILLDTVHRRLSKRLKTLDRVFERYTIASLPRRIDRSAIQEGLISTLWQSWCGFCRDTIMACATGATTTSGATVGSPFAAHSELEIAFIASQLSNRRRIGIVRPLAGHHLEPTWGDVTKLNLIANGMNTTNKAQLISAFSAALSLRDLQLSRNASAHLSVSAIAGINAARVRYNNTKFAHPSDVAFWVDPSTRDYLWKTWIDEMTIVAGLATA